MAFSNTEFIKGVINKASNALQKISKDKHFEKVVKNKEVAIVGIFQIYTNWHSR